MADYLAEHTFLYYGAATSLALALAVLSCRTPLIVVSAILWLDWLACNVTVGFWGYAHAPLLLPSEAAMFLGFTILLNRRYLHDTTVRMVAYLFLVAIIVWLTFIVTGQANSYAAYACVNLVYLLAVVFAGGSSARWIVVDRMAHRDRRSALRPVGGSGAGAFYDPRGKAPE